MHGPNVGSPLNYGDEEHHDQDHVGANYSILPIRDVTVRERWKYRMRRWLFYLMFVAFIAIVLNLHFMVNDLGTWFWVIHILYFDLDVTVTKNQNFIRYIHGCSFIGSFITTAMGSMVIAFEPDFINNRSHLHHRSVVVIWVVHSFTNYLPPFFHLVDLIYNFDALRKRHYFFIPGTIPKPTKYNPFRQALRIIWLFVSPVGVVIIWFVLHLHPEYDVIHTDWSVTIPTLVVIDILAGVLLIVILITRPKPYPPLLGEK